jgi:uncharacterized protein involved in outer membrane biogenesis
VAIGAVALIAAVLGLLHIAPFPVDGTEKLLSARLQEPVRIGSLHFAVYPSPHWTLERITIGNVEDIKIGEASVPATSLGSYGGSKRLGEVQLSTVTLGQDAVARMAAWIKPRAGNESVQINSLRVSGITLSNRDIKLPVFDATVALAADGALKNVILREPSLNVELTPGKDGEWTGKFKGRGWRPPVVDGVEFSDLSGNMRGLPGQVAISGIVGTLYSGSITGEATVKWGRQINVDGQFNMTGVDLGQLLPAVASGFNASGALDASMTLSNESKNFVESFAAPRVAATFTLRKGVINNVDMVRALQSGSNRGGKTPFDEIRGEAQVSGNHIAYRNLNLNSAQMKASGAIDVSPKAELSGRINVLVGSQTVTVARGTLNVGGSVKNPVLNP